LANAAFSSSPAGAKIYTRDFRALVVYDDGGGGGGGGGGADAERVNKVE